MSKRFRLTVPDDFPKDEKDRLFTKIEDFSFMVFPRHTTENQIEFSLPEKYTPKSVDEVREIFKIPDFCTVEDRTGTDYSVW